MTNAELSKMIKKYLAPVIGSEYSLKDNILYRIAASEIILGFCFERLANDKDGFYLWVFTQPLYVPTEDFNLTFGIRLKRKKSKSERWELFKEALEELVIVVKTEGLEFLETVSDANKFYEFLKKDKSGGIRIMEAKIYTEFYCELPEATNDATHFIKHIHEKEDLSIGWVKKIKENSERLLNASKKSGEEVQSILREWIEVSAKNLGI